jgi:hypothetical protein
MEENKDAKKKLIGGLTNLVVEQVKTLDKDFVDKTKEMITERLKKDGLHITKHNLKAFANGIQLATAIEMEMKGMEAVFADKGGPHSACSKIWAVCLSMIAEIEQMSEEILKKGSKVK